MKQHALPRAVVTALALCITLFLPAPTASTGNYIVLVNNDLGMHCMNQDHSRMSILPPYNNMQAQIIKRGGVTTPPEIVTTGITLEYSFPGNTYSAGKTNFWDYVFPLFGVHLAPDVGLTGKMLTGTFDLDVDVFRANGIPITPFSDASPAVEDPFQVAQVILRRGSVELARAYPVVPVSTEINCVGSGCHASEQAILESHEGPSEGGFDPANKPILCAQCHGSTPLTGPNPGTHGWFSKRIHEKHAFIDAQVPGINGCYKCHPGPNTRCLRGTMNANHNVICQDCHGNMENLAATIDSGRIPWLNEPSCRSCHMPVFGEPVGQLYRNSRGHGGVLCSNCHNSPHADFPSRVARDNRVMIDIQGRAGILTDCTVCHSVIPAGPGPHNYSPTGVQRDLAAVSGRLRVFPSPSQPGVGCTIVVGSSRASEGKLLVYDVQGRVVRLLHATTEGENGVIAWDGRDANGRPVASGTYFLRWNDGRTEASGKIVLVR